MAKEIKINIQMNGILIELSPEEAKSLYFELHQIFAKEEIVFSQGVTLETPPRWATEVMPTHNPYKHFEVKY